MYVGTDVGVISQAQARIPAPHCAIGPSTINTPKVRIALIICAATRGHFDGLRAHPNAVRGQQISRQIMDVRLVGPRCPFQRLMSLPAPHPHPLEAPFPGEICTASPPGEARVGACGWCTVAAGGVAWFRPRTKFFTSKSFFSPSSSPSLAPSFCDCRRLVVLLHFLPLVTRPSNLRYSFILFQLLLLLLLLHSIQLQSSRPSSSP